MRNLNIYKKGDWSNMTKIGGIYSILFPEQRKLHGGAMKRYKNRKAKECHGCHGKGYEIVDGGMHVAVCTTCWGYCVLPLTERDIKEIANERN